MRVLLIGDGIALTTGFATVIRQVAAALVARGDEVAQIASLDLPPGCDSRVYYAAGVRPFFPESYDPVGRSVLERALNHFRPERVFLNMDPGLAYTWLARLRSIAPNLPVILYGPLEGGPPAQQFADAFFTADRTVLYTRWAAEQLGRFGQPLYPWVWHGVDREQWHPLAADDRARTRETLGWTDRFVVAYVGRNVARKAQPVLMEAMAAVARERPETLLYLHCAPFDSYLMQGWNLAEVAAQLGVGEFVEFPSAGEATRGEPETSLARKVACADLVVHAAQVEGFGLPIVEAMAAGTPLIIPADGGNMQEVAGDAPLLTLDPALVSSWFTGARLVHVAPQAVAAAIVWAQTPEGAEQRARASARGLRRAPEFSWREMTSVLLGAIDDAAAPAESREAKGQRLPGDPEAAAVP